MLIRPPSLRVAVVQARGVDESLALCDLAGALLERGHRPRLFLDHHERDLARALRGFDPDLLLVQSAILAEPWLRDVLARLDPRVPQLLVGTGVTFDAGVLARVHGDAQRRGVSPSGWPAAVRGELDDALPPLVERLAAGEALASVLADTPGGVWRDGDELRQNPLGPQPRLVGRALPHRGLYFDRYRFLGRFPWKRFAGSRGCVHACGYCYAAPLRALHQGAPRRVRRKSVDRVIAEVLAVRARWPLTVAHFADDLFASSIPWLEELAERWPAEVGLPFSCNTSGETLSEHAVHLLARAGARMVGLGLESGVPEIRAGGLGRTTPDSVIRASVARLREAGVAVTTFNMVGAPGERFEDALRTVAMNQELGVDRVRATLAWPMPGSAMHALSGTTPEPQTARKDRMQAVCAGADAAAFESLAALFRLGVVGRVPPRALGAVARRVPARWLRPLTAFDGWQELRWSGAGVGAGLRYAAQAGRPLHRVTYHAALP